MPDIFPITNQAQFDAAIKKRLDRERKKYQKMLDEQATMYQDQIDDLTAVINQKHNLKRRQTHGK